MEASHSSKYDLSLLHCSRFRPLGGFRLFLCLSLNTEPPDSGGTVDSNTISNDYVVREGGYIGLFISPQSFIITFFYWLPLGPFIKF